jgi:3-hydroxybutyryl-CoA dehydrogenase
MDFKNITIAGSGVLGYQIAFQTAYHGFKVTVYDINDEVLEKAKNKFKALSEAYQKICIQLQNNWRPPLKPQL